CSRHPEVLWAQRSDKIYLTIALPDAKDVSVKCQPQGLLSFSAMGKQGEYFDLSLELYGKIVPERCKTNIGLRNTICSIQKEERGWWTRLLKPEEKPAPYLKVDWNKWCDEDEESTHCKLVQHIIGVLLMYWVMSSELAYFLYELRDILEDIGKSYPNHLQSEWMNSILIYAPTLMNTSHWCFSESAQEKVTDSEAMAC
ncbi:hypothetical protein RJ639_016143, partial [Escallonia herrerae]